MNNKELTEKKRIREICRYSAKIKKLKIKQKSYNNDTDPRGYKRGLLQVKINIFWSRLHEMNVITHYWEELECIFDNLCYDDIPENKRPANYDEKKEKVFNLLDEVIEILKELGL